MENWEAPEVNDIELTQSKWKVGEQSTRPPSLLTAVASSGIPKTTLRFYNSLGLKISPKAVIPRLWVITVKSFRLQSAKGREACRQSPGGLQTWCFQCFSPMESWTVWTPLGNNVFDRHAVRPTRRAYLSRGVWRHCVVLASAAHVLRLEPICRHSQPPIWLTSVSSPFGGPGGIICLKSLTIIQSARLSGVAWASG